MTHESDLDGLVSGLLLQRLARTLFNTEVRLEAYHNHAWRKRAFNDRAAWVCDFSFEQRLDKQNWLVIDHHVPEAVPQKAQLIHDLKKSAGLLCYELCQQNGIQSPELDRLVQVNNVADLFLENDPDFVLANDYANLVKNYGFWNLHAVIGGKLEKLLDHPLLEVMVTKRRIEDPIGLAWSRNNVQRISATVGLVNTVVGNTNSIVHQLLEQKATPYSVLLTLFRTGNGAMLVSLRSRNGEALKVAEKLQGGGHANAAGATLPRSIQYHHDAIPYLQQVLNPATAQPARALNSLGNLLEELETGKE